MNEFMSSNTTGRYNGVPPVTPFHKDSQDWDNILGKNIVKAGFYRRLSYVFILLAVVCVLLLLLNLFLPEPKVRVVEVNKQGAVIFGGRLHVSPVNIPDAEIEKANHPISLDQWQKFLDHYISVKGSKYGKKIT